ncbi:MAG: hypothetical protein ACRDGG_07430 [Anaerolineae bacterium]
MGGSNTDMDETIAKLDQLAPAWRRAESKVSSLLLLDEALYSQYLDLIRALADALADVLTLPDLVTSYELNDGWVREVAEEIGIREERMLDLQVAKDAAYAWRYREVALITQQVEARRRIVQARESGAEWVTLYEREHRWGLLRGFERVEMLMGNGIALHYCPDLDEGLTRVVYLLEVLRLDRDTGQPIEGQTAIEPTRTLPGQATLEAELARLRQKYVARSPAP